MKESVRNELTKYADLEYRDFSTSLIPNGSKPLLGVRLPQLRKLAKDMVKNDWLPEVSSCEDEYADIFFEETMLRGMVIGYGTAKKNFPCEEGLVLLKGFIPHIDTWSVCDSFCNSFSFANAHRGEVWEFMQPYLYSDKEYEVRTALILLLSQYLKYDLDNKKIPRNREVNMADIEDSAANRELSAHTKMKYPYLERILNALNREFCQGYYAQMAAAWLLAETFICFPYETNKFLTDECRLDVWTYNKALQKIRESLNPDKEVKEYMKSLKK